MPTANPIAPMAGRVVSHARPAESGGSVHAFKFWGKDGFTFGDILDAINPLEQLPVVGTIYRHLTGHSISPASRIMGGALFGGPIGAALSAFNAIVQASTGKGVGERVLEALDGNGSSRGAGPQVAAAVAPVSVFPSGRPPEPAAGNAGKTASHPPALAQAAARPRPGGWIINAAYGLRDQTPAPARAAVLPTLADRASQPAAPASHRPRPGGWMVNAAYASVDAAERAQTRKLSASA